MVPSGEVGQFPGVESCFALSGLFGKELQPTAGQFKEVFHHLVAFDGPRGFAIKVVHQGSPSPAGFVWGQGE